MNSWVKLILIIAGTWMVVHTMREGWGGGAGGGDLPKSVAGPVAQAKALNRKVVLLITGSNWCPACQAMDRGMLRTAEWSDFAGKEIVFKVYDYPDGGRATSPAHEDLLKLPGFRGFPTLVVADGAGRLLDMRAGYSGGAAETIQWIRSL